MGIYCVTGHFNLLIISIHQLGQDNCNKKEKTHQQTIKLSVLS